MRLDRYVVVLNVCVHRTHVAMLVARLEGRPGYQNFQNFPRVIFGVATV